MKPLFTVFALLFFVSSFGQPNLNVQTNERAQVNDLENIVKAWSNNNTLGLKAEDVEGSAYLDEQFVVGEITLNTGVKYSDIPMRYNAYNDLIEFQSNSGIAFNINNPSAIQELMIGKSKFIYADYKAHKRNEKLFTEVLAEGDINLLKRHRIKIEPAKQAEAHKDAQAPRFIKIPSEYLIQFANKEAHFFRNKKELLNILSDKKNIICQFIEQEKLSANSENDLIRIVNFYNLH